jgi:hypothetical protein
MQSKKIFFGLQIVAIKILTNLLQFEYQEHDLINDANEIDNKWTEK